jgi:hypothetical protein
MNIKNKTKILLSSILVVFFIGACAGSKPVPGGGTNIIGNIDVSDQDTATVLTIEGSTPLFILYIR